MVSSFPTIAHFVDNHEFYWKIELNVNVLCHLVDSIGAKTLAAMRLNAARWSAVLLSKCGNLSR